MYCEVVRLSNTVSVPSVTVTESLVQVTVVAGPPVEIQVRVNLGLASLRSESKSNDMPPVLTIPNINQQYLHHLSLKTYCSTHSIFMAVCVQVQTRIYK